MLAPIFQDRHETDRLLAVFLKGGFGHVVSSWIKRQTRLAAMLGAVSLAGVRCLRMLAAVPRTPSAPNAPALRNASSLFGRIMSSLYSRIIELRGCYSFSPPPSLCTQTDPLPFFPALSRSSALAFAQSSVYIVDRSPRPPEVIVPIFRRATAGIRGRLAPRSFTAFCYCFR